MNEAKENRNNKNTAVLTIDDLERIKEQCSVGLDFETEQRTKERNELKQKSSARVQNWPNTISALRSKREQDRITRLENEEVKYFCIVILRKYIKKDNCYGRGC
jgi:hypothetical protein